MSHLYVQVFSSFFIMCNYHSVTTAKEWHEGNFHYDFSNCILHLLIHIYGILVLEKAPENIVATKKQNMGTRFSLGRPMYRLQWSNFGQILWLPSTLEKTLVLGKLGIATRWMVVSEMFEQSRRYEKDNPIIHKNYLRNKNDIRARWHTLQNKPKDLGDQEFKNLQHTG